MKICSKHQNIAQHLTIFWVIAFTITFASPSKTHSQILSSLAKTIALLQAKASTVAVEFGREIL